MLSDVDALLYRLSGWVEFLISRQGYGGREAPKTNLTGELLNISPALEVLGMVTLSAERLVGVQGETSEVVFTTILSREGRAR